MLVGCVIALLGLLVGSFHFAFALVLVGTLHAFSWCCAVTRPVAFLSTVETEAIIVLFVALWVGNWLCGQALPFALVVAIAIAPCAGRVLTLMGLLRWRVTLLVCRHVVLDRFR